nr:MAG TPA: hypothetical protein [Caudoviricetes sp.]
MHPTISRCCWTISYLNISLGLDAIEVIKNIWLYSPLVSTPSYPVGSARYYTTL